MLTTPPFRRAPWLLLKRPVLLTAVLGVSVILGLVASLTPLFGSSAASAALQRQLEGRCQSSFAAKMPSVTHFDGRVVDELEINRDLLRSATESNPAFAPPNLTLVGGTGDMILPDGGAEFMEVRIFGLEDFRSQVELASGTHGDGAYIDSRTAEWIGAGPGDEVQVTLESFDIGGNVETTKLNLTVAAVYEDVYHRFLDPYWCSFEEWIAPSAMGDLPPAPILLDSSALQDDRELFLRVFGGGHEVGMWQIPVRTGDLTVTGARSAAATIALANESLPAALGEALNEDLREFEIELESDLPGVTERVDAQIDALQTSIFPLATVVLVAAVGLLGAAGSYWVDRRRSELALLSALGASPVAMAIKACLELAVPTVLGAGFGWGLGNLLIGAVGPSPDIEGYARGDGLLVAMASVVAGLVVAMIVVGLRAHRLLDPGSIRARQLSLRWVLIVLSVVAAFMVRRLIGDQAVTLGEDVVVGSVNPLVLLFPVLVLIAAVLLVSELITLARRPIRRAGEISHAGFLASRRILSAPAMALALVAGAAVPIAVLVYSTNLARSATVSIDAKGKTSIGSDVSTLIYRIEDVPDALASNSTIVVRLERANLEGEIVDVVAVDPATFTNGGFWLDTYAARPLDEILSGISTPQGGTALKAVVANSPAPSGVVDSDAGEFRVEVVETIAAFPGSVRNRPLLIVDRTRLHELLAADEERIRGGRYLIWTKDLTEHEVDQRLADAGIGFAFTTAADTTLDQLKFAVIIWTFEFLALYAALAGMIVIAAVLIHTDARQRARNLSYALARRMGLTRRDHVVAGIVEVGSLTLSGALVGLVVGRWAARDLYRALDPLPETPPGPQWVGAVDLGVVAVVVVLALAIVSATISQRTADHADVSDLLRHGE